MRPIFEWPAATPLRALAFTLLAAALAGPAHAQGTNTVRITGGVLNDQQTTTTTPAVVGTPFTPSLVAMPIGEVYFGQADGLSNTLRGQLAQKGTDNSNEPQGRSDSQFLKTVGAGTSGLANGAPVQVMFNMALDGSLGAGALDALTGSAGVLLPAGSFYTALSSARLTLTVIDLSNPASSLFNPDLKFEYITELQVDMRFAPPQVFQREVAYAFSPSGPWVWSGNQQTTTTLSQPEFRFESMTIPQRPFSFAVDTAVGHVLSVRYQLVIDSSGTSDGATVYAGYADFGRTFDLDLVPLAAGVVITPDIAGVAALPPVPEPATAALWLAGLCGLVGWRARRQRH